MGSITLDTHSFIKQLQSKGISEEQFEAIVQVVMGAHNANNDNFASKSENTLFKSELRGDFSAIRSDLGAMRNELKNDINLAEERLKSEINLLKWGMGVSITLSISILLKILFS